MGVIVVVRRGTKVTANGGVVAQSRWQSRNGLEDQRGISRLCPSSLSLNLSSQCVQMVTSRQDRVCRLNLDSRQNVVQELRGVDGKVRPMAFQLLWGKWSGEGPSNGVDGFSPFPGHLQYPDTITLVQ